jgi:hypothetical protein
MVVGSRNSIAFMPRSGTITGLPASLIHTRRKGWEHAPRIGNVYYLVLSPFQNIRCFSFVKQMYLDIF